MIVCHVTWVSRCDGCQTEEKQSGPTVWPGEWRDFTAAGMPLFKGWKRLQVERGTGVETYLFCPRCAPWPFLEERPEEQQILGLKNLRENLT